MWIKEELTLLKIIIFLLKYIYYLGDIDAP